MGRNLPLDPSALLILWSTISNLSWISVGASWAILVTGHDTDCVIPHQGASSYESSFAPAHCRSYRNRAYPCDWHRRNHACSRWAKLNTFIDIDWWAIGR